MNQVEFKKRTKGFAIRVIRLAESLPETSTGRIIGRQLIRSGTSVGANYRAACRARSTAEFISRIGIVEEECDETLYWMEIMAETGMINRNRLDELTGEANEILSMVVSSIKTARSNK
jgi:four helix bundle protein